MLLQISKSGILKKAIDYINYLQSSNAELRQKNSDLKRALAEARGGSSKMVPSFSSAEDASSVSPMSQAGGRSGPSSPESCSESRNFTSRPMMDRSRVTLLVFMSCLLIMNPFQLMLGGVGSPSEALPVPPSGDQSSIGGRTLLYAFDLQGENCQGTVGQLRNELLGIVTHVKKFLRCSLWGCLPCIKS